MDYLVAVLLPQLLHGVVFGAALGLLALGLTVIFGLLGVMNFAHGELYMLGAYAGIAVVGVTHSFWVARSEEHTSELQSRLHLVCRLLLEKKKKRKDYISLTDCAE